VINAILKPIVKAIGCLFYILTLGLIGLVVNALLLWLASWAAGRLSLPFHITGFWPAFWGAIIVGVVIVAVAVLSVYYLVRGEPLLVQGEVDATRFDTAARVDGRVGEDDGLGACGVSGAQHGARVARIADVRQQRDQRERPAWAGLLVYLGERDVDKAADR